MMVLRRELLKLQREIAALHDASQGDKRCAYGACLRRLNDVLNLPDEIEDVEALYVEHGGSE